MLAVVPPIIKMVIVFKYIIYFSYSSMITFNVIIIIIIIIIIFLYFFFLFYTSAPFIISSGPLSKTVNKEVLN
jgi:hypothetical protein